MNKKLPVSVLILTLDEEKNLPRCIEALGWSDDIVVLDSYSNDLTVDVAKRLAVRVYQRKFDNFAAQRNFALDEIEFKHDWILHLDADEVVLPELKDEIHQAIQDPNFDAYRIAGKLMLGNKWLRYSGMFPVFQVRLGRKAVLRFKQSGHGQRESIDEQRIGTLRNSYIHYCFSKGVADWIERHNRYSTDEALVNQQVNRQNATNPTDLLSLDKTRRRRSLKKLTAGLPFRPFLRFVYMYVVRLGFLDGKQGLIYCRLLAQYEYWTLLKERELKGQIF